MKPAILAPRTPAGVGTQTLKCACVSFLFAIALASAAQPTVQIVEKKDEYVEYVLGNKPIWRFVTPAYDPKRHAETYKPYLMIYDFHGQDFLTKGAGGQYTHHRGVFFGCNKLQAEGKSYDFWHMLDLSRQEIAGPNQVDWKRADGTPLISETREWTTTMRSPRERLLDFRITLRATRGAVRLDGDLQHAGFHFRAAQEVAEKENATFLLPPDFRGDLKEAEKNAPRWACMLFEVRGKQYGAMLMNHPDNGGQYQLSTRAYGRFGFFCPYDLVADKPRTLRYCLYLFDAAQKPKAEALEAEYQEYVK